MNSRNPVDVLAVWDNFIDPQAHKGTEHDCVEARQAMADLLEAVDNAISEWEAGHDSYGPMDYLKWRRSAISGGSQ